ncbi:germination protein YpeB [Paenibacillus abyssi]|uniref:Germination protein YpeB n=1 Tax=Paenibacillus abyssi TaxID=1340531 RepID=A0A917CHJ3_9BACL|nr:germination protein YpeB [Paenibacillus abyssi]GGF87728.1 germination protein YpeB [Paenibacillus abyssi]
MYQRLSAVLFPIMTLFLIGSVYWGYQEHQDKNSILIKAENQYQRAFHELSYDMDQLHNQLGHTLAVNSTSQGYHRKSLVNVWRLTSDAQSKINQLPLTMLPFNQTEDFLAHIASFTYRTAVRDLTKEPLTEKEYETMKSLYEKSEDISKDLKMMQSKVLQNNLRWMDVEVAIASEQAARDNTIIDGFKTVDKKVEEYPEINWGPSVSAMFEKRSVNMLDGNLVTAKEVQAKAADFFGIRDASKIKVTQNGKGTEYTSFSATVPTDHGNLQMDFTQKGGKLIWFMDPRDIGPKKVGAKAAEKNALQFLDKHGYPGMTAVNYDGYDNVGNFTFVAKQNDVLIYPEKLTVKVAMDKGEAVGLQAADYVYEHHKRDIPKPKLTVEEARKVLNPEFKLIKEQKALIKNELSEEVLCYEFMGRINGHYYRIYVNSDTGIEESIEQLPGMNGKRASSEP